MSWVDKREEVLGGGAFLVGGGEKSKGVENY